jgi:hypothetical protein
MGIIQFVWHCSGENMKDSVQAIGRAIRKKGLLSAFLLLALIIGVVGSAQAGGMVQMDRVQTGSVIEKDVFLTGDNPTLDGIVNGDVFAFGSNVTIKGDIDGSLFIVGNQVVLDGDVTGSVYSLALSFDQTETSSIVRSLYILAVDLSTQKGSTIGRDLWTVALSASLQGDTARDTKAVIGLLQIYRILRDSFNRSILGMSPSNLNQQVESFAASSVRAVTHLHSQKSLARINSHVDFSTELKTAQAKQVSTAEWLLQRLQALVTFFLIGGLILWWKPDYFQRWADTVRSRPVPSAGYGFVILMNGFLVPFLLLAIIVGFAVVFFFVKLPAIGLIILGGGLSSLGLAFTVFLTCATYLSKAIVAYLAGTLILNLIWQNAVKYKLLSLFLGLTIYVFIAQIPIIGWVTGFLLTILGLGAMWLAWFTKALPEVSLQVEPEIKKDEPVPSPKKRK